MLEMVKLKVLSASFHCLVQSLAGEKENGAVLCLFVVGIRIQGNPEPVSR